MGTAVLSSYSQNSADKGPTNPSIVSNVDEVVLDVVVRDRKNRPVSDLKPWDLAVTDGGEKIKISELRQISGKAAIDHLITLVFDQMNAAGASNARSIVAKILKAVPPDGFSLSVMKVQGRLRLYQEFTSDRQALARAINLVTAVNEDGNGPPTAEKELFRSAARDSGDSADADQRRNLKLVSRTAVEDSQRILQERYTSASLAGLLALARSQSKLPGRKIVIYFAQDLNVSDTGREMLAAILGAAHRANVSIYTVDVSALSRESSQSLAAMTAIGNSMSLSNSRVSAPQALTAAPPPHAIGDLSTPGMATMAGDQFQRFEMPDTNGKRSPFAELASATGGVYISVGENVQKPLRRMVADMTNYFELSYVAPIKGYNGEFRSVSVQPVRKGLKVRSEAGYFALPLDEAMGTRPLHAALFQLFSQTQLPQDLKIRANVLGLGELTDGNTSSLVVEVPISQLEVHDDPNTQLYSLRVSIAAQIKDRDGRVLERFSEEVPQRGALESKQDALTQFVTMQRHFLADPGEYTLETAILDRNSGKTGALRSRFTIASSAPTASISDLILVRRMDPFNEDIDPGEPLRFGNRKVIPDLAARFSSRPPNLSLFSLIHLDPHLKAQPRLEMTVMKDGEPIAQVPLSFGKDDPGAVIPYVASIGAASLPPGDYQVIETLTQGEEIAEQRREFRIDVPDGASTADTASLKPPATENPESTSPAGLPLQANTRPAERLVIAPLSTAVEPPSSEQMHALVEEARNTALLYSKGLPNFLCVEVTSRSVDHLGKGDWKHRDTIAELLSYVENYESRTMLQRNGERTNLQRTDLDSTWPLSVGEFGGLLSLVFQPASKADFQWKDAVLLGKDIADVLSYRVTRQNATIGLSDDKANVASGFHGLAYVDRTTRSVRRITLQVDDLPRDFSIHAASMTVDYDYVTIGSHDYMMPVRAVVALRRGRRQIDLNEISFRNYRRYASTAKIKMAQ